MLTVFNFSCRLFVGSVAHYFIAAAHRGHFRLERHYEIRYF